VQGWPYTKAENREGACSSHGGVKDWFEKVVARPVDATGQCQDGTYTTAETKSGACSGHKGVKHWYGGDSKAASKAESKASPSKPAPEDKPSATARKTPDTSTTPTDRAAKTPPWQRPATAAPGGGAGRVWVNTSSKVYHCEKDMWYGKTKHGEYMTQAQAKTSGARPAYGKECS
jgi:hypothetical protein